MKLSLRWLKELVPGCEPLAALDGGGAAFALTTLGLEVENVEEKGRELRGVVVAEVLAVRPHPGADKLRLVRVRAASREEEVVCGASNVPGPGGRALEQPITVRRVLDAGPRTSTEMDAWLEHTTGGTR